MKKILIIEDDEFICEELANLLQTSGYLPVILKDFSNAMKEILTIKPDLILLDIHLPYRNGEILLQSLRKESNIPVIMVTSQANETDEVLSMSYGADDYITKPYNPNILLLRIGAVLRRMKPSFELFTYKELVIDFQKGIMNRDENEVFLTKNEMIILYYFVTHQNQIVTRDELMTALWNNEEYINDNALTVNISRLRGKLKEVGYEDAIETRKKMGYLFS